MVHYRAGSGRAKNAQAPRSAPSAVQQAYREVPARRQLRSGGGVRTTTGRLAIYLSIYRTAYTQGGVKRTTVIPGLNERRDTRKRNYDTVRRGGALPADSRSFERGFGVLRRIGMFLLICSGLHLGNLAEAQVSCVSTWLGLSACGRLR